MQKVVRKGKEKEKSKCRNGNGGGYVTGRIKEGEMLVVGVVRQQWWEGSKK